MITGFLADGSSVATVNLHTGKPGPVLATSGLLVTVAIAFDSILVCTSFIAPLLSVAPLQGVCYLRPLRTPVRRFTHRAQRGEGRAAPLRGSPSGVKLISK